MTKDYIKIYDAVDKKTLKQDKERIQNLQKQSLYPNTFNMPLTLQFELTYHCNVFCRHCYNNSGIENKKPDPMTPEKWIDFAKYLVSKGGIFECILSGGEPLTLGNSLFEIMDILHDDGTSFLLITNGYLLNEEKIEKLSKYRYRWLQVSIDGSEPEYHDWFRQKENSWKHAVEGAFMVSSAGIPLTIAHCVTPRNLDKIDDMCELAYSLGAGNLLLGEVNLSGRTNQNKDLMLNREERNKYLEKFDKNLAKYQGKMQIQRGATVKNSVLQYTIYPNQGLIIRPNGDMRLDCMAPFVMGNILKDDFYTIWKDKKDIVWNNQKVKEYIENFDINSINEMITNYVDEDIHI